MCKRQSRKVTWDIYNITYQYTVPDTVAVQPAFVAFLQHSSMTSRAFLSNFLEKPPIILFRIVACTFPDNLSRNSSIPPELKFPTSLFLV